MASSSQPLFPPPLPVERVTLVKRWDDRSTAFADYMAGMAALRTWLKQGKRWAAAAAHARPFYSGRAPHTRETQRAPPLVAAAICCDEELVRACLRVHNSNGIAPLEAAKAGFPGALWELGTIHMEGSLVKVRARAPPRFLCVRFRVWPCTILHHSAFMLECAPRSHRRRVRMRAPSQVYM